MSEALVVLNILAWFVSTAVLILAAVVLNWTLGAKIAALEKKISGDKNKIPEEKTPPVPAPVPVPVPEIKPKPIRKTAPREKTRAETVLDKFWRWFTVGDGYRKAGVSAEYAAATTWLIRAGVIGIVCGVLFFLKYSIDNNLVNPAVRVCGTFAAGIAMFCFGCRAASGKYRSAALGVLSAGAVTLYLGAFAAFRMYGLIPAAAAFALMVLVTGAVMLTSLRLNSLSAALTGCAGGFLTPVLISTGQGDLVLFLAYLVLMSAAMLPLARLGGWKSLELLSFILSSALILVGCLRLAGAANAGWCVALLVADYLVYSAIPLLRKKGVPAGTFETVLPILSAGFTLTLAAPIASEYLDRTGPVSALVCLAVSLTAFLESIVISKTRPGSSRASAAFLCAAVFALALALPLAVGEAYLSASWSILAFALILAARKTGDRTVFVLGSLTYAAAFAAAVLRAAAPSWSGAYPDELLNRFLTVGILVISLAGAGQVLRKSRTVLFSEKTPGIFFAIAGFVFFFYSSVEVFECLSEYFSGFRHGGLSIWWALFAVSLLAAGIRRKVRVLRHLALGLFGLCVFKVALIDIAGLNTLGKVGAFLALGVLFLGGAVAYIRFQPYFKEGNAK